MTRYLLALALTWQMGICTAAERHLLVVTGLGGEPYFTELFQSWTKNLLDIAERGLSLKSSHVVALGADPTAPSATKESVLAALDEMATAADPGDLVMVILIGHGTANSQRVAFNLAGPDLLAPRTQRGAFSNSNSRRSRSSIPTASSAAFLPELSGPNRIVITATATASENYHTQFAGHWIEGLVATGADRNKDRKVSLLEVFTYAKRATARAYESDGRLLTEHPQLDDNGDSRGSREPRADADDGPDADQFFFHSTARGGTLDQEIEARRLVAQISQLKREKGDLHAFGLSRPT